MNASTSCLSPPLSNANGALVALAVWATALVLFVFPPIVSAAPSTTASADTEVPLVIGNRTIHVFRSPLGAFSASERAEGARQRILKAFEAPGEGWTSTKAQEHGVVVELDGVAMFTVTESDVPKLSTETVVTVSNAASHTLQIAWREARERRDPRANLGALMKVLLAGLVLVVALVAIWKISRRLRDAATARLAERVEAIPDAVLASRMAPIFLGVASRSCVLLAWLLSLLALYVFMAHSLDQFALTRAMGEGLFHALSGLLVQGLNSVAAALPGMFVATLVFLVAWVCTQISSELFNQFASGQLKLGMLNVHTAPATRHIVNALLWLFALVMAYPYLPGAQTEAFKGLSVILGVMVSIGASGPVGQIASGLILVYTRALSLGEYVRIQEYEGTVTEMGLFVTRIRTGVGEEIALPNAVVLGNVTRNFSRATRGAGFVLDTTITIGYDTPWRQVHAMLLEATKPIAEIASEPAPCVMQSAFADFYVVYRLVVYVNAEQPFIRARVKSDLHASIQDVFNRYGVQIMSPNYFEDPDKPKIVPPSNWYAAPASPTGPDTPTS